MEGEGKTRVVAGAEENKHRSYHYQITEEARLTIPTSYETLAETTTLYRASCKFRAFTLVGADVFK